MASSLFAAGSSPRAPVPVSSSSASASSSSPRGRASSPSPAAAFPSPRHFSPRQRGVPSPMTGLDGSLSSRSGFSPSSSSSSASASASLSTDPADLAAAAALRGALSAGTPDPLFAGAYGYVSSYDELPAPPGPDGAAPSPVSDSFSLTGTQHALERGGGFGNSAVFTRPMLRGSHSGRLELHPSGAFRARLTHQAFGPHAEARSINLDVTGRWVYLVGSSRLVFGPNDPSVRLVVAPLPPVVGGEDDDETGGAGAAVLPAGEGEENEPGVAVRASQADVGLMVTMHKAEEEAVPGGTGTQRVWRSLSYPLQRVSRAGAGGGASPRRV